MYDKENTLLYSIELQINLFRIDLPRNGLTYGGQMVGPRPQSPQGQPATKIETPLHSILIGNVNAIQQGSTATSPTRYYERRSHAVTSVKGCDIFSVYQIDLKLYTQGVMVAVRYPRLKGSENSPSGHGDHSKYICTDCRLLWYSYMVFCYFAMHLLQQTSMWLVVCHMPLHFIRYLHFITYITYI